MRAREEAGPTEHSFSPLAGRRLGSPEIGSRRVALNADRWMSIAGLAARGNGGTIHASRSGLIMRSTPLGKRDYGRRGLVEEPWARRVRVGVPRQSDRRRDPAQPYGGRPERTRRGVRRT